LTLRTDRLKRRQRRADQGAQPPGGGGLGSGARYNINAIDIVKQFSKG
jgi:hypothetical protein